MFLGRTRGALSVPVQMVLRALMFVGIGVVRMFFAERQKGDRTSGVRDLTR